MNLLEENKNYPSILNKDDFPVREGLFSILKSTKQVVLNSTSYKDFIFKSSQVNKIRFQSPGRLKFPPIDANTFHLTYKHETTSRTENLKQLFKFNTGKNTNLPINSINYRENMDKFDKSQPSSESTFKIRKGNEVCPETISIEDLYDKEAFLKKNSKDRQSLYKNLSKDEILSHVREKVKDLIKNGTENTTSSKSKSFFSVDQKRNYKLELTTKSLYLRIKESSKSQNKVLNEISFELPFSFLYLYYFTNNSTFTLILSQIIKFDENYSKLNIDIDKANQILKIFEEKISHNGEIHLDSNLLIKNTNYSVDIMTPTKIFQMTVNLPSISMIVSDLQSEKKIIIKKIMPKSLAIQILQKNFLKWDLYVIDYLTEYKNFRENILLFTNNNIIISKRSKKFDKEINFIDLDAHEKVPKPILSEEKKFELIYINQSIQNIFISLESYMANYNPNYAGSDTQFNPVLQTIPVQNFQFNFRQALLLEKVSMMKPLDVFLNDCLIQKGRGRDKCLEMDYQVIDNVDDDFLLYLLKNNSEKGSPEKDKDQNQSAFSLTYPQLNCLTVLDNNGFLSSRNFSIEIPSEIFLKFENLETCSPSQLIKQFLNEYINMMESTNSNSKYF
jgi:hypothetical protein